MDLGVAMRTNAGRAPERAVKYGNSGRTAVITAHMVPGVTFKQSSLSGEAAVPRIDALCHERTHALQQTKNVIR